MDTNKIKRNKRVNFRITGLLTLIFILFTTIILTVDFQPIGPKQSLISIASLNTSIHSMFGINLFWYRITQWADIIAMFIATGFALWGLVQLLTKRSLKKIDRGIIALGAFYVLVAFCYFLFETIIITYRPVMMDETLEASFPSSHTMIVICIMASSMMHFRTLLKNRKVRSVANFTSWLILFITVNGRLVCGVHWFTDIVSGLILGSALVMLYYSVLKFIDYHIYI